jgi:hypothetical protein
MVVVPAVEFDQRLCTHSFGTVHSTVEMARMVRMEILFGKGFEGEVAWELFSFTPKFKKKTTFDCFIDRKSLGKQT